MTAVATCTLRRFHSAEAAAAAVRAIRETEGRGPNDFFRCERCDGWHLRKKPSTGLTVDREKQRDWNRRSAETAADRRTDRLRRLAEAGALPELARVSEARLERDGDRIRRAGSTIVEQGRGMQASPAQQAKSRNAGECRILTVLDDVEQGAWPQDVVAALTGWHGQMTIDSAHVACDHRCPDPAATIPLCRPLHRAYDERRLSILNFLTREEEVHATREVGVLRALERVSCCRMVPAAHVDDDPLMHMTYDEQADVVAQIGLVDTLPELTGVQWFSAPLEVSA